jgi:hypothetical protein
VALGANATTAARVKPQTASGPVVNRRARDNIGLHVP